MGIVKAIFRVLFSLVEDYLQGKAAGVRQRSNAAHIVRFFWLFRVPAVLLVSLAGNCSQETHHTIKSMTAKQPALHKNLINRLTVPVLCRAVEIHCFKNKPGSDNAY